MLYSVHDRVTIFWWRLAGVDEVSNNRGISDSCLNDEMRINLHRDQLHYVLAAIE